MGESDAIGFIDGFQVDLGLPDAELDGYKSAEEVAALGGIERRERQLVHSVDGFLLVAGGLVAHLPDEVVRGLGTVPRLEYPADAEPLVLHPEELPRALQLAPELHEAFLGVLDFGIHFHFDTLTP